MIDWGSIDLTLWLMIRMVEFIAVFIIVGIFLIIYLSCQEKGGVKKDP